MQGTPWTRFSNRQIPNFFEITLSSLVKKNVFTSRVDENGKEEFSLTNVAAAWLDNDLLIDTLLFDFKGKRLLYNTLFLPCDRGSRNRRYGKVRSVRIVR